MCMFDPDAGYWEFANETTPTARKAHRCGECGRVIAPGEKYVYLSGKFEGYIDIHKTCRHCAAAREWLTKACEGYVFNMVLDDLREHWNESPLYQSSTLQSLIFGMEQRWHDGADPVPDVAAIKASVPVAS